MQQRPYQFPYCLHCYAPLEFDLATDSHALGTKAKARKHARASVPCPQCDEINLVVDISHHWTKEPVLVEIEWWMKAAIVALLAVLGLSILITTRESWSLRGHEMLIGVPLFTSVLFWDLASITRKKGLLNGAIVWGGVAAILGLGTVLVLLYPSANADPSSLVLVGCLMLIGMVLPGRVKQRWEAWRDKRVANAQSRLAIN